MKNLEKLERELETARDQIKNISVVLKSFEDSYTPEEYESHCKQISDIGKMLDALDTALFAEAASTDTPDAAPTVTF